MLTEQYDLQGEQWRDLVSYPSTKGVYWISNLGRYKSLYKGKRYYYSLGCSSSRGYRRIDLRINGNKIGRPSIHDLVAEAFIRPMKKGEIVHHRSGDKSDNHVQNLKIMKRGKHTEDHHKGKKLSQESLLKRQNIKREKRLIDPDYGRPMKGRKRSLETTLKIRQTKRQKKLLNPNYGTKYKKGV